MAVKANYSPVIDTLIHAFRCLPGIGPKSAQRMVFHLLERNRDGGQHLASALIKAIEDVRHCQRCRNLTEQLICQLCSNTTRNAAQLCILESPSDVLAIEQTGVFHGLYFVLMGHLSPIDGIGPTEIGIDILQARLTEGEITEVILATNPTVEGEATAHYVAGIAKQYKIKISRIAYGVPIGSELEYVDGGTLARALSGREEYT